VEQCKPLAVGGFDTKSYNCSVDFQRRVKGAVAASDSLVFGPQKEQKSHDRYDERPF
jgi:hypothetical protein